MASANSIRVNVNNEWRAAVRSDTFSRHAEVYIYNDQTAVSADGSMYTLGDSVELPEGFVPIKMPIEALRGLRDTINAYLGEMPEKFAQEAYAREVARNEKITNVLISLALNGMDDAVS